jgi:hypothetical protein
MRLPPREYRRVLLIDHDLYKQHLRAAALRNCEIKVDAVNSLAEAQSYWTSYPYDLVLFASKEDSFEAALLSEALKQCRPVPRIALLVGAPHFVREIGEKRKKTVQIRSTMLPPVMPEPLSQPSQWNVMMSRLMTVA